MKNNEEKLNYTINVRAMVEFLLRHGDITSGGLVALPERAQLGAEIHRKIQSKSKTENAAYIAEKALHFTVEEDDFLLNIEGRCDGYFHMDGRLCIDEIKTIEYEVSASDPPEILHAAQALCYAAMLLKEPDCQDAADVIIDIIYYNIHDKIRTDCKTEYTAEQVKIYFRQLLEEYCQWLALDARRKSMLQSELSGLQFPFSEYRRGQRELAVAAYKTIFVQHKKFYANAPTGIGKTISMLFPALKAMGAYKTERLIQKIFYFTATNAGSQAPVSAAALLSDQLPQLLYINLTAKEKLCPRQGGPECDPELCTYAKGHYDRVNACIFAALQDGSNFTKERVAALAAQYTVCPFELQLDLSLWCDLIVGDYNYLFNPTAKLQRYFGSPSQTLKKLPYVYLIDEAHNLPDRAREMYSVTLQKKEFLEFSKLLKTCAEKAVRPLQRKSEAINRFFVAIQKEIPQYPLYLKELNADLVELCLKFTDACYSLIQQKRIPAEIGAAFLEIYFNTSFFCTVSELFNENYTAFYDQKGKNNVTYTLYCVNPSEIVKSIAETGSAALFFSGTLLPFEYYLNALGCDREEDRRIKIPSPFPPENKLYIAAADVCTTYAKRANYYEKIAKYIELIQEYAAKKCGGRGNFMVFFSSYRFLQDVYDVLDPGFQENYITVQPKTSVLSEREAFLDSFEENPQKIHIGLCVLGGVFSEGIDLPGSRLSGAVIVGVGLPMVCTERELISMWHEEQEPESGFLNAYVYPGFNKVLQAAGRVIRTMDDRGFVLFLDNRYFNKRYEALFAEGNPVRKARNISEVKSLLFDFHL